MLRAGEDRLDHREALTEPRLRDVGDSWDVEDAGDRRDLVRHRVHPGTPGPQHLGGPFDGPGHRARVQLRCLEQLDLHRGHDAEAASAAPHRPEQLGLGVMVGPHEPAVGGDDLDRGDGVGRETSPPRQPTETARERAPHDTHVRG